MAFFDLSRERMVGMKELKKKKDQEKDFKEENRNVFDREKCVGGENIAGTT